MPPNCYDVTLSYTINVEADSPNEAEKEGLIMFGEIAPRPDEMNVKVEKAIPEDITA